MQVTWAFMSARLLRSLGIVTHTYTRRWYRVCLLDVRLRGSTLSETFNAPSYSLRIHAASLFQQYPPLELVVDNRQGKRDNTFFGRSKQGPESIPETWCQRPTKRTWRSFQWSLPCGQPAVFKSWWNMGPWPSPRCCHEHGASLPPDWSRLTITRILTRRWASAGIRDSKMDYYLMPLAA